MRFKLPMTPNVELRRPSREGNVGRESDDRQHGIAAHTGLPVRVALERLVELNR
jgi:hypothetical protein